MCYYQIPLGWYRCVGVEDTKCLMCIWWHSVEVQTTTGFDGEKIRAVRKIFAHIIRQTIEYVIYYSTVIYFSSILAYNYNFDGLIRALYRSLEAWAKVRENNTNETIKLI